MFNALFAQHFLNAADRHPIVMQQLFDATQQQHIGGPVIPPPAGTLDRFHLRELAFPKAQHMGRRVQPFGHLANGSKGVFGFCHPGKPSGSLFVTCGHALFHQMRGAERQHTAGMDRNLFAGFGVTTHAGGLVADAKGAKG